MVYQASCGRLSALITDREACYQHTESRLAPSRPSRVRDRQSVAQLSSITSRQGDSRSSGPYRQSTHVVHRSVYLCSSILRTHTDIFVLPKPLSVCHTSGFVVKPWHVGLCLRRATSSSHSLPITHTLHTHSIESLVDVPWENARKGSSQNTKSKKMTFFSYHLLEILLRIFFGKEARVHLNSRISN